MGAMRPTALFSSQGIYTGILLFIAGMGGFLYGYDIGIIGAALLYVGKSISLTLSEESLVVAAVLAGSTISSLVAGVLADWIGRKKLMIAAALLFIGSVILMVMAQNFPLLFSGRVLQGLSAGMIAVVIPLYLAESLPAGIRGMGTAAFQLLLTCGILLALKVGAYYTQGVATVDIHDTVRLAQAQDYAWRAMFQSALYPALLFLAGSFYVAESPRWLLRHGRNEQAKKVLGRSRTTPEVEVEFGEMAKSLQAEHGSDAAARDSLWQRKYIVPFLLSCAVLGLTQATGINSILQFIVIILRQGGLSETVAADRATQAAAVNVLFTVVGLLLVERIGRKALLKIGTAGIVLALVLAAGAFYSGESQQVDVTKAVQSHVVNGTLTVRVDALELGQPPDAAPAQLAVLYRMGDDEKLISGFSNSSDSSLRVPADLKESPIIIERAKYGPVPSAATGNFIMGCLMLFFASFAVGPGVCVWLALSELMPTRIRSLGMGLGLLINQGISTIIAALFLPLAGNYGYAVVFIFWAACTVAYFLIAAIWLPETKGKTLEEIEDHFAGKST